MEKIKIALTGESGYIASQLKKDLWPEGAVYLRLDRNESNAGWLAQLEQADVVINLAGAPVIQRWTDKNRQAIRNSRVETTRRLITLLNQLSAEKAPKLLISGSAIGIYPGNGEKIHTESSSETGNNFLSEVVQQWESEAFNLNNSAVRLVVARIGIVLGREVGILKKLLPVFRLGLGGKLASGSQAMSFIHIGDVISAFRFFIQNEKCTGIYNMVAPQVVSNREFTKSLAGVLKRPTFFTVPAFALQLAFGKAANIMIQGEKVYPEHLLKEGFEFRYPGIDKALGNLID